MEGVLGTHSRRHEVTDSFFERRHDISSSRGSWTIPLARLGGTLVQRIRQAGFEGRPHRLRAWPCPTFAVPPAGSEAVRLVREKKTLPAVRSSPVSTSGCSRAASQRVAHGAWLPGGPQVRAHPVDPRSPRSR